MMQQADRQSDGQSDGRPDGRTGGRSGGRSNGRVLAILTVRDEGAFLLDWLAWHRWIGFTDFLVFSNDCADGTDRMLDRLAEMSWLTHVPNPGPWKEGPQWAALKTAARHPLMQAADWVMVIDIDEFLTVHAGDGRIADLFARLPDATAHALTWRLFGNDGQFAIEDRPIPERFTRAAPRIMGWPWRAAMIKTLYRNDGTWRRPGVHRPRQPDAARLAGQRWYDGSGRLLPERFVAGRLFSDFGQDNYALAQVNHYPLGSMQDYALKIARGRANIASSMFDISYWVERNLNVEEDHALARRFAACADLRAELAGDPVLAAAHEGAVAWRQERFEALMREEPWRRLMGVLMMAGPSRPIGPEGNAFLARHARAGTGRRDG